VVEERREARLRHDGPAKPFEQPWRDLDLDTTVHAEGVVVRVLWVQPLIDGAATPAVEVSHNAMLHQRVQRAVNRGQGNRLGGFNLKAGLDLFCCPVIRRVKQCLADSQSLRCDA